MSLANQLCDRHDAFEPSGVGRFTIAAVLTAIVTQSQRATHRVGV
jgi:hypothetical protein